MAKIDLADEETYAQLPPHRFLAALLAHLRVLVAKGHGTESLPDLPDQCEPAPPPERDSDLDELRRILRDNPALVTGIRTGDFEV